MKKKSLILIIVIILLILIVGLCIFFKPKREKINVYLFWGDGCPHCEHAKEFFNDVNSDYSKYYNLVDYEVWYDTDNKSLLGKVATFLNTEVKGVPFIVIGDEYFSGYSNDIDTDINNTIISMYKSNDYIDVVEKVK